MSLQIDLSPEEEARLQELAARRGIAPAECARQLVSEHLTPVEEEVRRNAASITLLESWLAEAPTDPQTIEEAEQDLREFKHNMNLPRREAGARLHYPEVE